MKKKSFKFVILLLIVVLIAVVSYKLYRNKVEYVGTPLEPMYKLVKIQHFDKGTYSDYKELFTDPKSVLSEIKFEKYRKSHTAGYLFKYDFDSISGIMKHMKAEKQDENTYKVYYMKNINDKKEEQSSNYWMVVKNDNEWLIKN